MLLYPWAPVIEAVSALSRNWSAALAKYYFDITDGRTIPDINGTELLDVAAVRSHAIGLSSALLGSHSPSFWRGEEWLIEAKDDIGVVLFTLAFRASDIPVVRREAQLALG